MMLYTKQSAAGNSQKKRNVKKKINKINTRSTRVMSNSLDFNDIPIQLL